MPLFKRALAASILPAAILSFLPVAAHSGQLDCGSFDPNNKIAVARIVTTEARLNFIAGPSKRMQECPSPMSACRLKAFVVAGDEVLIDLADGPFLCATFKSAGGMETRGLLPRQAVQLSPPETATMAKWDGKWRRDREAEIVIKSKSDVVSVSGNATWGGGDPARVKRGAVNTASSMGRANRAVKLWPSVMIRFDRTCLRRMRRVTAVLRDYRFMVDISWSKIMGAAAV